MASVCVGDNGVRISVEVRWRVKGGDNGPVDVGEVEITCDLDELVWGDTRKRKL